MKHQRITIDISIFIFLIFSMVKYSYKIWNDSENYRRKKKLKSFPGLLGLITVKTSKRIVDTRPHIYEHKDIVYIQHNIESYITLQKWANILSFVWLHNFFPSTLPSWHFSKTTNMNWLLDFCIFSLFIYHSVI